MTNNNDTQTELSVVLSREEVLAILRITNLPIIPGLGEEPIPNLTVEQQALSLIVAERSLRARGLASIDAKGHLRIYSDVLRMLYVCALPSLSVFITVTQSPSGESTQFIAHHRDNAWVLHNVRESVLHAFLRTKNWSQVFEQITTFCQWSDKPSTKKFILTIPSEKLKEVRELAVNNRIDEANKALTDSGNDLPTAKELTSMLTQAHQITIMQCVTFQSNATVGIQTVTTLHKNGDLFVGIETEAEGDDSTYTIRPVSSNDLKNILTEIVSKAV